MEKSNIGIRSVNFKPSPSNPISVPTPKPVEGNGLLNPGFVDRCHPRAHKILTCNVLKWKNKVPDSRILHGDAELWYIRLKVNANALESFCITSITKIKP